MKFEEAKERFQPHLDHVIEQIKEIDGLRQIVVRPERTYCDVFAVFEGRYPRDRREIQDEIHKISLAGTIIERDGMPDLDIWVKARYDEPLATVGWYDEEVYRDGG